MIEVLHQARPLAVAQVERLRVLREQLELAGDRVNARRALHLERRATRLISEISHPALSVLGISAVLIEEEGQPEPDGDTGLYKVPIKMVQWKKPTPALASPKGAFGDPSFTPPRTAAEREMAKLTGQVEDLLK